jgi:hypothetical protein
VNLTLKEVSSSCNIRKVFYKLGYLARVFNELRFEKNVKEVEVFGMKRSSATLRDYPPFS